MKKVKMMKNTCLPVLAIFLSVCYTAELQQTSTAIGCTRFPCRDLGILGFPFFISGRPNKCGLIEVDCYNKKIRLGSESRWFDVLHLPYNPNLRDREANEFEIQDTLLEEGLKSKSCDSLINITTLPRFSPSSSDRPFDDIRVISSPFISYNTITPNRYTFMFMCTGKSSATAKYFGGYYNYTGCSGYSMYYTYPHDENLYFDILNTTVANLPPTCSVILVPVLERSVKENYSHPFQFITSKLKIHGKFQENVFSVTIEGELVALAVTKNFNVLEVRL